ncbi:prolipoprotein diacylglyceryl transferase [Pseudochryseolinea flava]|uniref:Phosphatidylglycerol--prolipoprotein diacylglyceryl transferase n=2 Tax=Pseudochryseolinea flava TaxID=2059302 RepID=A0A364Y1B8_9BACT|nr:prolipoprotein diacylglyceryl transferase [Pseudochryseolinea flava]
MNPVLFDVAGLKIYSYGFFIAIGALLGILYMAWQGKRELGLKFDQVNSLFLLIFVAAFVGGKVFLFFEDPSFYLAKPSKLFTGNGFVFYGSFIFAVPTMIIYFKRQSIPIYAMLDVMAVTTCLVHIFGRLGCFMAGCCHGSPTSMPWGVVFTDPACQANPKGVSLHPSQLYESMFIVIVLVVIFVIRKYRVFYGQLFLSYLMLYAVGRFVLEYWRGDVGRGFVIDQYVSHSQFIALCIFLVSLFFYVRWYNRNRLSLYKKPI